MNEGSKRPALIFEEKKAIKLFLWLFYISYFAYDLFWYMILPKYSVVKDNKFPGDGLGYWLFLLILIMLPISIFLIKKGNPYIVKYFLLISYVSIDFLDNFLKYFGTTKVFASGHIVEIFFVLFAPIFVNKKYFWTASAGVILKYFLLGVTLHTTMVIAPMLIIIVLSAISYFLLTRFFSYINSLTIVYEELRKKEMLAVVGQMAAAIGHEIRNPLSSLKGFTQLQHEKYPNTNEYYPIMIEEIDRINSIVSDLMYIGKPKSFKFEKVSIYEIITYTLSIMKQQAENHGVTLEKFIEETLPTIECDENRLKQVFINLLKNAIEAMPNGGKVIIQAQETEENNLCISIVDRGCGIAKEDIENLGEPFYSTKREGTGLGLMVTSQIISDHNGSLKFESVIEEGTKVTVTLPISQI